MKLKIYLFLIYILALWPSPVQAQISSGIANAINPRIAAPSTCSPNRGDVYFDTTTKIPYFCSAPNTWTAFNSSSGTPVSVKSYGAVGNGIANDTVPLTLAINGLPTSGGIVYLPPGTYLITAPYIIAKSGVTIQGAGPGATVIKYTTATRGLVIGQTAAVSNVSIRDLSLTSTASGVGVAGRGAIQVDGDTYAASNVFVNNVTVDTVDSGAFYVSGMTSASNISFTNIYGKDIGEHGVYLSYCTSCYVGNARIYNSHTDLGIGSVGVGVKVSHSTDIIIQGIDLYTGTNDGQEGLLVETSSTRVVASGIRVKFGGTSASGLRIDAADVRISDVIVDGAAGFANSIAADYRANCSNSTVSGLITAGSLTDPVMFRTGSTGCVLDNAIIANSSLGYAVDLAGSTGTIVQNISITAAPAHGINLSSSVNARLYNNTILVGGTRVATGTATGYIWWDPINNTAVITNPTTTLTVKGNSSNLIVQNASGGSFGLDVDMASGAVGIGMAHGASSTMRVGTGGVQALIISSGQIVTLAKSPIITETLSPGAADACAAGKIAWDTGFIYVCTASGAWKRAPLTGGY